MFCLLVCGIAQVPAAKEYPRPLSTDIVYYSTIYYFTYHSPFTEAGRRKQLVSSTFFLTLDSLFNWLQFLLHKYSQGTVWLSSPQASEKTSFKIWGERDFSEKVVGVFAFQYILDSWFMKDEGFLPKLKRTRAKGKQSHPSPVVSHFRFQLRSLQIQVLGSEMRCSH